MSVGASVGLGLGDGVGEVVGASVGPGVGVAVGPWVGGVDGAAVGLGLGLEVGASVGVGVGATVVGLSDGGWAQAPQWTGQSSRLANWLQLSHPPVDIVEQISMSHEPVQTISGVGDIDGASVGGHEHGHMSWSRTPSWRLSQPRVAAASHAAASLHVGEPVGWRVVGAGVGEPVVREYDRQRFWPSHETAAFDTERSR